MRKFKKLIIAWNYKEFIQACKERDLVPWKEVINVCYPKDLKNARITWNNVLFIWTYEKRKNFSELFNILTTKSNRHDTKYWVKKPEIKSDVKNKFNWLFITLVWLSLIWLWVTWVLFLLLQSRWLL